MLTVCFTVGGMLATQVQVVKVWFLNHTLCDRGRPLFPFLCSYQCHDLNAIYALSLALLNNPFPCFPLSFIALMLPRFVLYIYLTLLCITACFIVFSPYTITGCKPSFIISQVRCLLVLPFTFSYLCAFSFYCWHNQRILGINRIPIEHTFLFIRQCNRYNGVCVVQNNEERKDH